MQRLAYGTHIIVGARRLEAERLYPAETAAAARELAGMWPLGAGVRAYDVEDGGASVISLGSQGFVVLHAFPEERWLVAVAFAVGEAPVTGFVERIEQIYDLGVYDLQRSRYGVLFQHGLEAVERLLLGERFVARARMVPNVG